MKLVDPAAEEGSNFVEVTIGVELSIVSQQQTMHIVSHWRTVT